MVWRPGGGKRKRYARTRWFWMGKSQALMGDVACYFARDTALGAINVHVRKGYMGRRWAERQNRATANKSANRGEYRDSKIKKLSVLSKVNYGKM